jgi:hypothetical protein
MIFRVPSIQVDESEHSNGNDNDENHDSCASRQNEYDDSQGYYIRHDDGSYYSKNENDSYVSHSQHDDINGSALSFHVNESERLDDDDNDSSSDPSQHDQRDYERAHIVFCVRIHVLIRVAT